MTWLVKTHLLDESKIIIDCWSANFRCFPGDMRKQTTSKLCKIKKTGIRNLHSCSELWSFLINSCFSSCSTRSQSFKSWISWWSFIPKKGKIKTCSCDNIYYLKSLCTSKSYSHLSSTIVLTCSNFIDKRSIWDFRVARSCCCW